jgi:hypothetical protein
MHMAAAAAGLCDYIKYITNFSCHTFGMLIAVIYAVTGAVGIAKYYTRSQSFAACLMETILALGTTLLSLYLANASNWVIGNEKFRTFVSDYAPTVAIVIWTGISLIGRADDLGSDPEQEKGAKFPTSLAPISAVFHSFRLIFGRAIISWNGPEAWMMFPERARAEHSR